MSPYNHPRLRELLAGILADPAADGPRFAWADALAELGDGDRAAQERAEFVRLQAAAAAWGTCPGAPHGPPGAPPPPRCDCARRVALRRRERALLAPNWSLWMPGLGDVPRACGNRDAFPKSALSHSGGHVVMTFRRGFVEAITMPAAALTHLDAVRACQPVTQATLTTRPLWALERQATGEWLIGPADMPGRRVPHDTAIFRSRGESIRLLGKLWPGVTFALPDVPAAVR